MSSAASATRGVDSIPADGSWVAELEEAKELLRQTKSSARSSDDSTLVDVFLRLCQAYSMLRQWGKLEEAAKQGMDMCSSTPTRNDSSFARFQTFRKQARTELSVRSRLDSPQGNDMFRDFIKNGVDPDLAVIPHITYANSNVLQYAALNGDVRFMEALVAHGAAIDYPFRDDSDAPSQAPTDATALVMVCVGLAISAQPIFQHGVMSSVAGMAQALDQQMECAMQLVNLGADCNRKLNLSNAPVSAMSMMLRGANMDGKTALQLAIASKRKPLMALMQEHVRYSQEERAELVHCRCGSRLPWKQCHSTGIGQNSHYYIDKEQQITWFRFSPLARCPCKNTSKVYYKCCWKDTSQPVYLNDKDGTYMKQSAVAMSRNDVSILQEAQRSGHWPPSDDDGVETRTTFVNMIRDAPDFMFHAMFSHLGPKSSMTTWDKHVYAGCIERLGSKYFFWNDLHWLLDKSEIIQRVKEWNDALNQYCDDMGLRGDERARVIEKHKANPCAPCGRVGCDAFETKVREFSRCSRCKAIAYCSRRCQKLDWDDHRRRCVSLSESSARA